MLGEISFPISLEVFGSRSRQGAQAGTITDSDTGFCMAQSIRATVFLCSFLTAVLLGIGESKVQARTWRTITELSASERGKIDLQTQTSRDPKLSYLPAEQFLFTPPYTAEEMGLRAMEFPHSPWWNCLILDIGVTLTSTGSLHQEVGVVATLYLPAQGFPGHLYQTPPGQELFRWLSHSVMPPQLADESLSLLIGYRTDHTFVTPAETLVSRPELPPFRYQLGREDRAPNRVGTFEDAIGRNAWEFSWRILGTDVLYRTVRFPATVNSVLIPDDKGNPISVPTEDLTLMGSDYPAYTADGGVSCYVVEAVPQKEWLPNYSLSKVIYWLDQRSFFPLRIEQYDKAGKLTVITVRIATHANLQLGDRGYAMLSELSWDISRDLLAASTHGVILKEWSAKERQYFFHPGGMPPAWVPKALNDFVRPSKPEDFYLRPSLDEEKFPAERRIELPSELAARIAAQEREGHLVF